MFFHFRSFLEKGTMAARIGFRWLCERILALSTYELKIICLVFVTSKQRFSASAELAA